MMRETRSALELFVERLAWLSPLTDEECKILRSMEGQISQVRAPTDLVAPGEVVDHVCLVVDGLLGSFVQLKNGHRQITAFHTKGDVANLQSVAKPKAASAIQALSTTTIISFPHREVRKAAAFSPAITEALWAFSAADLTVLSQWTVNIARRAANARVAHLMCEMSLRAEAAGQGERNLFQLMATQTQLGDALALTSVHVNRTLKSLRTAGLLTVDFRTVRIPDWDALARTAEFDPAYLQLRLPLQEAA